MTLQNYADVTFLALTVWRESRGESRQVQDGVAHAIMNRVQRPSWWGNDIMSVVFKKWQFSSMTSPNDPQLTTWPTVADPSWTQCLQVASDVAGGFSKSLAPGADSYYDISISAPKWATGDTFVVQLGKIRFYNLDHDIEI